MATGGRNHRIGSVPVIAPVIIRKLVSLGRISTGEVIANCAWGDDGSPLCPASGSFLCRIKTTAKGIY